MTPTILALIVLALVVADFFLDLQLFGFSAALTITSASIIDFMGVDLMYWQWAIFYVSFMLFFVFVTRYLVKKTDSDDDINKY